MSVCKECGASIEWRQHRNGNWVPFNSEDIELNDEYDASMQTHFQTCRGKTPEKPLSYEARTRPGYL